jgi:glycosyltransferase involved in cell wall biosynthesis
MLNPKPSRFLIVSHEASYTGAPLLLIQLLQLINLKKKISFSIVIVRGGPLENKFKELGTVTVLKPQGYTQSKGIKRFVGVLQNRFKICFIFLTAMKCQIIFSNSIVNGKVLKWLRFSGKPVFTYVHELESVIKQYLNQGNAVASLLYSDHFFFPCEKVRKVLQESFNVPSEKLSRLNYYFPQHPETSGEKISRVFKKQYSFCGVGTASYRKGTDLFIEVVKLVHSHQPGYLFTWIGGFENKESEQVYLSLIEKYNLQQVIKFTGAVQPQEVQNLYDSFDVLLLTSREDPYPLVVLEAAYHQIPSVVFSKAGGITEFVNDSGWLVDEMSAELMAQVILSIESEKIKHKGSLAFQKVLAMHSDSELIMQQLEKAFTFN